MNMELVGLFGITNVLYWNKPGRDGCEGRSKFLENNFKIYILLLSIDQQQ